LSRALRIAVWVTLPSAAVFAMLVVFGTLSVAAAIVGWLAVVVVSLPVILPIVDGATALTDFVRHETGGDGLPATMSWRTLGPTLTRSARILAREWREREDRLAAALAGNEAILQSLPEPLMLLDDGHAVTFANDAARNALGSDPVGKDVVAVLRAPGVRRAIDAAAAGATPPSVTVELASETPRYFSARFQALDRTESGRDAMVLVLSDISEMWRTERLRADFVANASHEIRTPLATLVGGIETLQGPAREDTTAREHFLEIMHEQAERIGTLVDDLLSLSRIERSEHEAPSARVDLTAVLQMSRSSLEWKAKDREIWVKLDPQREPIWVTGDVDELRQLFENLIDNAIKYGDQNSEVSITAREVPGDTLVDGWRARGPAVAVAVQDHGQGISPEHLPRLTERFYRVDKARSRQMGGTGLGLAIVKHIVSRHRGTMTIESESGAGSCFTVYLNAALSGDSES
jgi:two-component system phosphate regulon sensor histidine kinase PhoR